MEMEETSKSYQPCDGDSNTIIGISYSRSVVEDSVQSPLLLSSLILRQSLQQVAISAKVPEMNYLHNSDSKKVDEGFGCV